jgi:uncharacterized membrane protein AbrB (regulator of aidB expression)
MTYDRDLGWGCIILWMLVAANLGSAALNAYEHHWLVAVTCVIWTLNLLVVIRQIRAEQRTLDEVRLVASGIRAMREEIED